MYQLKCDGYPLLDWRDNDLLVFDPKVKLEVNTVGEGSFTIYKEHPYYDKLKKLKSIFEVSDEIGTIFRGRMTGNTVDFDNGKTVDLEGVMAFFNDSVIRPFNFPGDFLEDADYIAATESGNVVAFFFGQLIAQHNSQVQDFQKLHMGNVTVSDPNNYISRSSQEYASTWETLKSKLFGSDLGGYLCPRYEEDGTYIDYLESFELTNTQRISYGENLLDLTSETDASETYSAIIPQGKDGLTIREIEDGDITEDIVKSGDTLFSRSAVESYGWIYAPVKETKWEDVTLPRNLLNKGIEWLVTQGIRLESTIEVKAVDLHFTDAEIRSFRIYRNIQVISAAHGFEAIYPLTRLDIDLIDPQNTKITVGTTMLTLIDKLQGDVSATKQEVVDLKTKVDEIPNVDSELEEIRQTIINNQTSIITDCNNIILQALKSYVETSNYEEFKQTLHTQLSVMSDQILMNFKTVTEQITDVDGDMQSKFTELYEWIRIAGGVMTFGSSDSAVTLSLENDSIIFRKNGVQFGYWDGDNFYTGNIVIRLGERFQLGSFAFKPRPDESMMLVWVGT